MRAGRSVRGTFWTTCALLVLLLGQMLVLTHDDSPDHVSDIQCSICVAGHALGSAVAGAVALQPLLAALYAPPTGSDQRPVSFLPVIARARGPPLFS